MRKIKIIFLLLLASGFFVKAQGQMTFTSSVPGNNAVNMAANANITLNFSDVVFGSTINDNIVVTGSYTGEISGVFSGQGTQTITFDPTNDFEPGEVVRVTLTTGLGNNTQNLAQSYVLEFRAAPLLLSTTTFGYATQNVSTTVDGAWAVNAADLDGDGDMDLVSGAFDGDEILWHENDGSQNFTQHVLHSDAVSGISAADGVRWVETADMDGDGDLDVLSSCQNGDRVYWYQNDGSQNFTPYLIALSAGASSVIPVDMDGDGDMDIAQTSGDGDGVSWYENQGPVGTSPLQFVFKDIESGTGAVQSPIQVYCADVDGDGDMDALTASTTDDKIAWYENDGSQNFTQHVVSTNADQAHSVFSIDMDGDGDMDIVSAARGSGANIAWYENDGSQNFTTHSIDTNAGVAFHIQAGDIDGDSDIDVVAIAAGNDEVILYINDGSQNFTRENLTNNADAGRKVLMVDLDGDGDMDVVSASRNDDKIAWYETRSSIDFTYDSTNGWLPQNPNGIATNADNIQILSGVASITQDMEITNITVDAGATLNVEASLSPTGNLTVNGDLVFISTATNTGQLGPISSSSTVTGDITVQRYIPGRRAFRFLSSAVTTTTSINANWQEGVNNTGINYPADNQNPNPGFGTHITGSTTGANGFDATFTGNKSLFTFQENNQTWNGEANTDVRTLDAGTAFRLFVRGDRSIDMTTDTPTPTNTVLRATGTLVTGTQTFSLNSDTAGDFNFVGNPYQAIVNMNGVLSNSTNLNTNYYYIWDPNLNARGAYVMVSLPTGTPTPATSDADEYIQPGQAAFVSNLANGSASIVFSESNKAVNRNDNDVFKPATPISASINLTMYESSSFANNGPAADGFLVNFSVGGNNAVDYNDAIKPLNIDENVGLVNGTSTLIMENRAMPVAGENLSFYNDNYRHSDYVFQIEVNGLNNVDAYLNDAYLGTQTKLEAGANQVNFSIDETIPSSISENRFSISFANKGLNISDEESLFGFELYPNPSNNGAFVITAPGFAGKEAQVSLYDLLGKRVYHTETSFDSGSRMEVQASKIQPGVYIVQLNAEGKSFTEKLIVQ